MKKIVTLVMVVVALLGGCSAGNTETTVSPTLSPFVETEEPSSPPSGAPGIAGSHYIDIAMNLEQSFAFPKRTRTETSYGHEVNGAISDPSTGIYADYTLMINKEQEICYALFGVRNPAEADAKGFETFASNYLGFCATMPYDSSDGDAARDWVVAAVENWDDDQITTTIGDAEYSFSVNTDGLGAFLEIRHPDFSKYLEDITFN